VYYDAQRVSNKLVFLLKLSSYLNKEVTVRFGKLKMQLWDLTCWPHVNPVPSGAVGKDCQRRLLSRPMFVRAVAPRIFINITCMETPEAGTIYIVFQGMGQ
jgi:hypothetical protein